MSLMNPPLRVEYTLLGLTHWSDSGGACPDPQICNAPETQPLILDELGRHDVAFPLAGLFPEHGQGI